MNIAIIAEYNPFHSGHATMITRLRGQYPDATVITLMSGNFVQRGEPAILDKFERARSAHSSADLVLELPFPYSCAVAEVFAAAAVKIIAALGNVDLLAFGSESGELARLSEAAVRLSSLEFNAALRERLSPELPYPAIRAAAYSEMYGEVLPSGSNDILALEYIRALAATKGADFLPFPVKIEREFSASDIRRELLSHPSQDKNLACLDYGERAILSFLRLSDAHNLKNIADMPVGLPARMIETASSTRNYREYFEHVRTKAYTDARLRRCLIYAMTGVRGESLRVAPYGTLLLASNERGRAYLRGISPKINVFTRISELSDDSLYMRAERLYGCFRKRVTGNAEIFERRPWIG